MTPRPLVSVIILNYNGLEFLPRCLESLSRTAYRPFEIVVVDNCSRDGSLDYLRRDFPDVRIIEYGENLGYSGAYNRSVPEASGEYCVLLNFDVEVEPEWLTEAIGILERDQTVAAVQPKLKSYQDHGKFEYSGGAGGFIDAYGYPFVRGRVFETIETDSGQYDDSREIFWATGAALVLRKSDFVEAGGLDEDFFMHMEELDFCWRLWLGGKRVMVAPSGTVYHWAGAALSADRIRKMYLNHRNSLAMILKNYGAVRLLKHLPVRIALDWIAVLTSPLKREPKRSAAILWAHWYLLWNLPSILRKRRRVQKSRRVRDQELDHVVLPFSVVYRYYFKKQTTFSNLTRL
ncbi:MAG: glycosyltransferase family 2 protein [Calditrichaeota bacterium]|nr:glycosyltransferase family 2 protein [Calditrichota bacterium]MCB9391161.1 glycosyltransferase family 2 protein [Calditrichota bacterium]